MNTQELENLLEGAAEAQSLDFKASCSWDIAFVKDILALSNIRNGGFIVIGVEETPDGKYIRKGISQEHKNTYVQETIQDQMSQYADPYVRFTLDFSNDKDGLEYCVIRVFEFDEVPVICKKDAKGIYNGKIYYRNSNRRVESAPISNSYDMRSLIQLATVKMSRNLSEIGFVTPEVQSAKEMLDKELEGL